jgi:hypothetical protein
VAAFDQDWATVSGLLDQASKNSRVVRVASWRQQMTNSLEHLSNDFNGAYGLKPPGRFQDLHGHLMNATYGIQRFSYLLAASLPTCSTCSADTAKYDEAQNQYLLFLREWSTVKNAMQDAQNGQ